MPPIVLAGIRRPCRVGSGEGCREGGGEAAAEDRRVGELILDGHGGGASHGDVDQHTTATINLQQQAEVQLQAR